MITFKQFLINEAKSFPIIQGKKKHDTKDKKYYSEQYKLLHGNKTFDKKYTYNDVTVNVEVTSHCLHRFVERYPTMTTKEIGQVIKSTVQKICEYETHNQSLWDKYDQPVYKNDNNPLMFNLSKNIGLATDFEEQLPHNKLTFTSVFPYTQRKTKYVELLENEENEREVLEL